MIASHLNSNMPRQNSKERYSKGIFDICYKCFKKNILLFIFLLLSLPSFSFIPLSLLPSRRRRHRHPPLSSTALPSSNSGHQPSRTSPFLFGSNGHLQSDGLLSATTIASGVDTAGAELAADGDAARLRWVHSVVLSQLSSAIPASQAVTPRHQSSSLLPAVASSNPDGG